MGLVDYQPGTSYLHTMDPRVKIIALLYLSIVVFMVKSIFIVIILFFTTISCEDSSGEKPVILVKQKQMIDMMVDMHVAEATFYNRNSKDSLIKNSSSVNFYHSILHKYDVPDSVFEGSLIYYARNPKKFEKMYRQVTSKLSEMEQEYSGRKNDLLDVGNREIRQR